MPVFFSVLLALYQPSCGWAQGVGQESESLRLIIDAHLKSTSLEEWHDSKELLETVGRGLWQKWQNESEHCPELKKWPTKYLSAISHWNEPAGCLGQLWRPVGNYHQNIVSQPIDRSRKLRPCRSNSPQTSKKVLVKTKGGAYVIRGELKQCELVLTFDDGPHPEFTPKLLDILSSERVTVNFFLVGKYVLEFPQIVVDTERDGHVIGNHSQSHKNFPKISEKRALTEIRSGFNSIYEVLEFIEPFFRFPYGAWTLKSRTYLRANDTAEFFWNIETRDWGIHDPQELYNHVIEEIDKEKYGTVLFHDVHPQTIAIMPHLLQELKKAGYTLAYFKPSP